MQGGYSPGPYCVSAALDPGICWLGVKWLTDVQTANQHGVAAYHVVDAISNAGGEVYQRGAGVDGLFHSCVQRRVGWWSMENSLTAVRFAERVLVSVLLGDGCTDKPSMPMDQ